MTQSSPESAKQSELNSGLRMSRPVSLSDLTEDLLWPKLLLVPGMALRPASVTIGFFALLIVGLVGDFSRFWKTSDVLPLSSLLLAQFKRATSAFGSGLWDGIMSADADRLREAFSTLLRTPQILWYAHPWTSLLAIPMIGILLIAAGAICRIAACEFAHSIRISWVEALGFALKRWFSLTSCILGPIMLILIVVFFISGGGWALFSLNWTQPIGALLYPLALIAAVIGVALFVLTILGAPLMIPAVACEGADGIEAMQRAFAYVPAKPIRYAIYVILLLAVGLVAVAVATAICSGINSFAANAAVAWVKQNPPGLDGRATVDGGFTSFMLRLWISVPLLVAAAYAMSVIFTSCTVLYLLLRKVIDGQAVADIWVPGLIPGTAAPTDGKLGANPVDPSVSQAEAEQED